MRSAVPKVLHPVCGRPMVGLADRRGQEAGAGRVAVIVSPDRDISGASADGHRDVSSSRVADGTGGAVRAALPSVEESETVLVLSGDVPLISAGMIEELLAQHAERGGGDGDHARCSRTRAPTAASSATLTGRSSGSSRPRPPATPTEAELAIKEINAGTYAFDGAPLADALEPISNDNAQGEYYLPDVLPILRRAAARSPPTCSDDPESIAGGQQPRRPRRLSRPRPGAGSSSATCSPASPSIDPGLHLDRRRRRDRRRHRDRARHHLRGADRDRRRRASSARMTTLIDAELGDGCHGRRTPT